MSKRKQQNLGELVEKPGKSLLRPNENNRYDSAGYTSYGKRAPIDYPRRRLSLLIVGVLVVFGMVGAAMTYPTRPYIPESGGIIFAESTAQVLPPEITVDPRDPFGEATLILQTVTADARRIERTATIEPGRAESTAEAAPN